MEEDIVNCATVVNRVLDREYKLNLEGFLSLKQKMNRNKGITACRTPDWGSSTNFYYRLTYSFFSLHYYSVKSTEENDDYGL